MEKHSTWFGILSIQGWVKYRKKDDDLCIIIEDTEKFLEQLFPALYNFKRKGSGELTFHLGCGFGKDSDGLLCMNPSWYVGKIEDAYKQYFKEMPN